MSDLSFGRTVKLRVFATTIGGPNGAPTISYDQGYTEFSSVQPDGSPGFRIRGKCTQVQPTVGFNTNQITLDIFNVGADSRAIIQGKVGTKIEILAGYEGNAKRIALADIIWARTHKEGPDYITQIIAGDAHFALVNALMNVSFSGQTSFRTVVDAIFAKLLEQSLAKGVMDIPDGAYQNGIVLNRSALVELSDVCRKMGRVMTVINGSVNILKPGVDLGSPVIEISEDTGMIGIPEVQPPGIIGVQQSTVPVSPDNDISVTHLLRSDLIMSQRFRVKSKFINGEYVVGQLVHDFDSWSGPFYSRVQAFKVQNG